MDPLSVCIAQRRVKKQKTLTFVNLEALRPLRVCGHAIYGLNIVL